jgi:hypothetical protein
MECHFKNSPHQAALIKVGLLDRFIYRKLPLKNTGKTLKGQVGTVLVTAHWVF